MAAASDPDRARTALALAALALVSAGAARLGFRCPVRAVFGIDCPGCGGTRAFAALAHGDLPGALRSNAAAVAAGVAVTGYVIAPGPASRAASSLRVRAERHRVTRWWARRPGTTACAAAALWCAARNLRR
ncbi:MAG: DUF2752 domain-containing protein [Streptosporangiales bacterium]|nr:DUF2752 domain-containing protein [Streptosporangiales bacterium]